jgi:hypothetical protein
MRFTEGGQPAIGWEVVSRGPLGSVVSGITGIIGTEKAKGDISAGQSQANALMQPFTTQGTSAVKLAGDLSGANGPDAASAALANYQTSPGYEFQLGQGLRAIDAGAASRGILRSGATIKGEQTFGSGLAATDFSNYYNRLMDLSKLGATTATGQAQTDLSAAGAQANLTGQLFSGIGTTANTLFSNPGFQSIFSGGGGSGAAASQGASLLSSGIY